LVNLVPRKTTGGAPISASMIAKATDGTRSIDAIMVYSFSRAFRNSGSAATGRPSLDKTRSFERILNQSGKLVRETGKQLPTKTSSLRDRLRERWGLAMAAVCVLLIALVGGVDYWLSVRHYDAFITARSFSVAPKVGAMSPRRINRQHCVNNHGRSRRSSDPLRWLHRLVLLRVPRQGAPGGGLSLMPERMTAGRFTWPKCIGWFVLLWAASAAGLAILAVLVRALMFAAGLTA
jgi:hypothetical protein